MLKWGADPNSRDSWNFTPLHEAAIKGKVDVCIGMLPAQPAPQPSLPPSPAHD